MIEAGIPGFEPRYTDSKSVALPLNYIPMTFIFYHNFFPMVKNGETSDRIAKNCTALKPSLASEMHAAKELGTMEIR